MPAYLTNVDTDYVVFGCFVFLCYAVVIVIIIIVAVVETWHLGPLDKVGGNNRERWGCFAEELLPQCYSVWPLLQPMFYGLQLFFTTRGFRVDFRIRLIGVSLEDGGVSSSSTGKEK